MTDQSPVQGAINRYFAALQTGDPAVLKRCFTEDASWHAPGRLPNAGTWRGRDAIVDEFFPIATSRMVPDTFTTELVSLTLGASNAVIEWRAQATTVSGESYENAYMANFVVADGAICEVREYFDTHRGETLYR
ncbi:hypothetical protein SAMN05660485_03647 [Blastococcus fimeti]|nr:hypothetical protein SAMN05660485_03647 [Blastococcus fimeti]